MSYLLQWRHATPKGQPGRVQYKDGLTLDDLKYELDRVLGTACWVYAQDNAVYFKGKTETIEQLADRRAKKGRKQ